MKSLPEDSGSLSIGDDDVKLVGFTSSLSNDSELLIGRLELIYGNNYDAIRFNKIEIDMFRHLFISRLFHPGREYIAIGYLSLFINIEEQVNEIYRFMDTLSCQL